MSGNNARRASLAVIATDSPFLVPEMVPNRWPGCDLRCCCSGCRLGEAPASHRRLSRIGWPRTSRAPPTRRQAHHRCHLRSVGCDPDPRAGRTTRKTGERHHETNLHAPPCGERIRDAWLSMTALDRTRLTSVPVSSPDKTTASSTHRQVPHRARPGRPAAQCCCGVYSQGLSSGTSQPWKSFVLRVTTVSS